MLDDMSYMSWDVRGYNIENVKHGCKFSQCIIMLAHKIWKHIFWNMFSIM